MNNFFGLNKNQNYYSPFMLLSRRDNIIFAINYAAFILVLIFIGYLYSTYLGYPHIRRSIYRYMTFQKNERRPVNSRSKVDRLSKILELMRQVKELQQWSPVSTENNKDHATSYHERQENHPQYSQATTNRTKQLQQHQRTQEIELRQELKQKLQHHNGELHLNASSLYHSLAQEEDKSDELVDTSIHGIDSHFSLCISML